MDIRYVDSAPRKLASFDPEVDFDPADVAHIAEMFHTPLDGSYNWDYRVADNRIKRLYELGKELNWNASTAIDWRQNPDVGDQPPLPPDVADELIEGYPWTGYRPFDELGTRDKLKFIRHDFTWSLSQFLHGEQGALLVASQLASCAPSFNAKLYAASQTFDEARHVEVFNRYLQTKIGFSYPVTQGLKDLLDKILTDQRWDLKFIGMQIILEGLALAAFHVARNDTDDPVLDELLYLVIRDEARHVTFGVNYLEEFVATLSDEEREARAEFAYQACIVSRDRLIANDVFRYFGWDVEHARGALVERGLNADFLNMLYARIIPNLKRIGLLTDRVRPKFEEMGVLDFENLATDGDIDWRALERPLAASSKSDLES